MLLQMQINGLTVDVNVIRAALVNTTSKLVEQVVVLPDGWPNVQDAWTVPDGYQVIESDTANPGDSYVAKTKTFVPPAAPDA